MIWRNLFQIWSRLNQILVFCNYTFPFDFGRNIFQILAHIGRGKYILNLILIINPILTFVITIFLLILIALWNSILWFSETNGKKTNLFQIWSRLNRIFGFCNCTFPIDFVACGIYLKTDLDYKPDFTLFRLILVELWNSVCGFKTNGNKQIYSKSDLD